MTCTAAQAAERLGFLLRRPMRPCGCQEIGRFLTFGKNVVCFVKNFDTWDNTASDSKDERARRSKNVQLLRRLGDRNVWRWKGCGRHLVHAGVQFEGLATVCIPSTRHSIKSRPSSTIDAGWQSFSPLIPNRCTSCFVPSLRQAHLSWQLRQRSPHGRPLNRKSARTRSSSALRGHNCAPR